ncbi:uncharacterized protein LOC114271592 [Camellia sinensis]|uniref:uncharacterized protein LOC114271592 n=1 Tax=Camellia sinensis TaxID=4442 RepID=UPI0010357B33|nr:uncharacterized protein LOC114271592 [Camellia sinensis]
MKREFSTLQKANKSLQSKMKKLEDQAEAAIKAQTDAEEKFDSAEAIRKVAESQKRKAEEKIAPAQKELQEALATKEAEIRDADEKAYAQGMDDVTEAYEKQVKEACNKGFTLGWMPLLKKLNVPEDSPLRNPDAIPLPFPPTLTPAQSDEDDSESEEKEVLVRKSKDAAGVKSPPQNKQVLDLTQDEEDEEVRKNAAPEKALSDVPLADKSLDETLKEIDAELTAEKDKPVLATDSADDKNVGVALSTALLLPGDLDRNAELSEYENYALMLQRSVQAIQHAHSFSVQSFKNQQKLVDMKREFFSLQKTNKNLQSKIKKLEDQAKAAIKAQTKAEEKAESSEAIRKLNVPKDSPLRKADAIPLLFPPSPPPSQDVDESESEDDEEGDEVPKDAAHEKVSADVPFTDRSIEETLQEIDAELMAEKAAEVASQQSSEVPTQLTIEAEEP